MKKILKLFHWFYKKIDIAPLDSSNFSFKITIFLVWGVNVLFFITKDVVYYEVCKDYENKFKTYSQIIQLSPLALPSTNDIKFFIPLNYGVISTHDVNLCVYEIANIDRERSPPLV